MQKISDFVKFAPSSLDKIHAKKEARDFEYYGDEYVDHGVDKRGEAARLEAEKIVGKTLYVIDKGEFPLGEFCDTLDNSEFIKHSDDLFELEFEDFSVYGNNNWYGGRWHIQYMDAKEVILPLKKDLKRGAIRLYIIYVDGKLKYLPELEYPTTIAPFLKYLKKKKKLSYLGKPMLWNSDKTIFDKDGKISYEWNWNCCKGYPMRNIKSLEGLNEYNTWLYGKEVGSLINDWNADSTCYTKIHLPKDKLDPERIDITQADVDDFIVEQNSRYQVKR